MIRRIRLFYAVPDFFPGWRLDVGHLFGEQLAERGLDITWAMWRDKAGPFARTELHGQRVFLPRAFGKNGTVRRLLTGLARILFDTTLLLELLAGRRFDIIQVRDRRYLIAFLAWLAARLRGARFTYWLSYPFPEHYLELSRTGHGIKRAFQWLQGITSFWFVYRWLVHRADHIFVQSEQMKRDLAAYGAQVEKMTPVPMGVPPALLEWSSRERAVTVPGRIVYMGTLARVRRLETLIEAFVRVAACAPNAALVIVGQGDTPSDRAFLEAEARRLGISDKVSFTGFVPMEEAWRHAASAEVCLSPFYPTFVLRSTSPTKLYEYMALGRPVVANDHPEQSVTLAESQAGLCVPWGATSFAEAILWLLEHPHEAEEMGKRGPDWVATNRTYDKIAPLVYARYQALAGGAF